jgi:fumarylacetoacetate (FAA) hydrolase
LKLATLRDGTPDGALIAVSRDLTWAAPASPIADTLQQAVERWAAVQPQLLERADAVERGTAPGLFPLDLDRLAAPLPRAWQWLDASAYPSHGALMQKAFGLPPIETDRPLMYQGLSDRFLAWNEPAAFPSEDDGIDLEGEFGVIVDRVPLGCRPADALGHVRLLVQINDWSLRAIAPGEMKTGFGWIQAKPPCSMAPIAITPDEIGGAWRDGRIDLTLQIEVNGRRLGDVPGAAGMAHDFGDLVAHAARTRDLTAGTIIGSGTVSSPDHRRHGSSCLAERRAIEMIDGGTATTPFLRFGDTVAMEAHGPADGPLPFGPIRQQVVRAATPPAR